MQLAAVQSWAYAPDTDRGEFAVLQTLAVDMVVDGDPNLTAAQAAALEAGGPQGSRLALGYLNVAQVGTYQPQWSPAYDADGDGKPDPGAPDWLGDAVSVPQGIYTAKFWTSSWEQIIFSQIDSAIAKGLSGIFLDGVGGFSEFLAGNPYGNAVRASAQADMVKLIDDIAAYVRTKAPGFLLLGNNAQDLLASSPSLSTDFNGLVDEASYWGQNVKDQYAFGPGPTTYADQDLAKYQNFQAGGGRVFSVDYIPQPSDGTTYLSSGLDYDAQYFALEVQAGVTPSLQNPVQSATHSATTPLMLVGQNASNTVMGALGRYNYIAGGRASTANILIGGDSGNFILGGPGHNVITGGASDDVINAHPATASRLGELELTVVSAAAEVAASVAPTLTVSVNGAAGVAYLVAGTATSPQVIDIPLGSTPLTSLGLAESSNGPSEVVLETLSFEGVPVALQGAVFTTGGALTSGGQATLDAGARADFTPAGSALPSPFPSDTSDVIDGGGGSDTVVYQAARADYRLQTRLDGSVLVIALQTAEGPDQLSHVAAITFSDQTLAIPRAALLGASLSVLRADPLDAAAYPLLSQLDEQVSSGAETVAQAVSAVITSAVSTSSVAVLSYQFFTGRTASAAGMDYLVSPEGPNPNNLNSGYYAQFNTTNRYINFASNLGKLGEGAAAFQASYGTLSLTEATAKAYAAIFGAALSSDKVDHLLHDLVPDGLGGVYEREDYFSSYGLDGLQGQGTKAAMVGWLISAAAEGDLGVYAKSNDAFLADIAAGKVAFGVDLIGSYARAVYSYTGP